MVCDLLFFVVLELLGAVLNASDVACSRDRSPSARSLNRTGQPSLSSFGLETSECDCRFLHHSSLSLSGDSSLIRFVQVRLFNYIMCLRMVGPLMNKTIAMSLD